MIGGSKVSLDRDLGHRKEDQQVPLLPDLGKQRVREAKEKEVKEQMQPNQQ